MCAYVWLRVNTIPLFACACLVVDAVVYMLHIRTHTQTDIYIYIYIYIYMVQRRPTPPPPVPPPHGYPPLRALLCCLPRPPVVWVTWEGKTPAHPAVVWWWAPAPSVWCGGGLWVSGLVFNPFPPRCGVVVGVGFRVCTPAPPVVWVVGFRV